MGNAKRGGIIAKQKYSNEYLIEILKGYARSIGKTPTYNIFEKDKNVPSATLYKKRFGSWNKALELAGLQSNAIRVFSKDDIEKEVLNYYSKHGHAPNYNELKYSVVHVRNFWENWTDMLIDLEVPLKRRYSIVTEATDLLAFLKRLYEDLGYIPTGKDIEAAGVNRNLFTKKFGSYKTALIQAEVVENEYFKTMEERLPESIAAIITYYKKYKKAPTVEEYELIAKQNNLAHRKALELILELRFSEICMQYLGEANQYKRSKTELLQELKDLRDKLGRTPMANELTEYGLAEKKQYYRTFKMTYNDLIESLGWKLTSNKMHFKSIDELLKDYNQLYNKLGRLPFYEDINMEEGMASAKTYKKYFKDLPNVWKALGIKVDKTIIEKMSGTGIICIDKNGGICRSYPEMIISNILIDLDLKFEKEVLYRRLIPNLKSNFKSDWILEDYNILIEYFGLFSRKALNEDNILGRYSRKVLEKIDILKKSNIRFIDLYPEDLTDIEEKIIKELENKGKNIS